MAKPSTAQFLEQLLGLLGPRMWVVDQRATWPHRTIGEAIVEIHGLLKPEPNEGGGRTVRRMFLDVFEAVLDDLAGIGVVHARHPGFSLEGEIPHKFGKPEGFVTLRCEVDFALVIPG